MNHSIRLMAMLAGGVLLQGLTAFSQPSKLAIVAPEKAEEPVADMLSAELSKRPEVLLLERTEINRILSEQSLSLSAASDRLKLGQLLSADGLLVLEKDEREGKQVLDARLIAVKPGVTLAVGSAPLPIQDAAAWSRLLAARFVPFLPKLVVVSSNAVPLTVLSLRSALNTPAERVLEYELTLRLIHRLTEGRDVFVLERQHLREVSFEGEVGATEEAPLLTGRYLLEGTLDKNGFDPNRVTISARLLPPGNASPTVFELEGPRADPAALVDALASKVLAGLHQSTRANDWRSLDEANRFLEEAKWCERWGLFREAQEACESAWALGNKSPELALLRIRNYGNDRWNKYWVMDRMPDLYLNNPWRPEVRSASKIKLALRALNLFCLGTPEALTNTASYKAEWFDLGLGLLNQVGGPLEDFYRTVEIRRGHEADLAELRSLARELASLLETNIPANRGVGGCTGQTDAPDVGCLTLSVLKWEDAGLWCEKPEEALRIQSQVLQTGWHPPHLPPVVGWTWEERKRLPALLKQFVEEIKSSTNAGVRFEGLSLALARAPFDEAGSLQKAESELLGEIWQRRRQLFSSDYGGSVLIRTERVLRKKYDVSVRGFPCEPFASFWQRLRKDYLPNTPGFSPSSFQALFDLDGSNGKMLYQDSEARELLPLFADFEKRVTIHPGYKSIVDEVKGVLAKSIKNAPAESQSIVLSKTNLPSAIPPNAVERPSFNEWKVSVADLDPDLIPEVDGAISRYGKVWLQMRYHKGSASSRNFRVVFVALEPQSGSLQAIPFPAELGAPDHSFEVTRDSLYVSRHDCLDRYSLRERKWETLSVPIPRGAFITALDDKLFLATAESILELSPPGTAAKIIASSRRQPHLNILDELGSYLILPGPAGSLAVLENRRFITYVPVGGACIEIGLPLTGQPGPLYPLRPTDTEAGILLRESGLASPSRLMAVWKETAKMHLLLEQRTGRGGQGLEQPGNPTVWDWPEPHALEGSLFTTDGKRLWAFSPRTYYRGGQTISVPFHDDRHATIIGFEPALRRPLIVPICFEKDGKPVDQLNPIPGRYREDPFIISFWFDSPRGLVAISPLMAGHWLISKEVLYSRFEAERTSLRGTPSANNNALKP